MAGFYGSSRIVNVIFLLLLLYWTFVYPRPRHWAAASFTVPQRFPPGIFLLILNPIIYLILPVISPNSPQRKGSNVLLLFERLK